MAQSREGTILFLKKQRYFPKVYYQFTTTERLYCYNGDHSDNPEEDDRFDLISKEYICSYMTHQYDAKAIAAQLSSVTTDQVLAHDENSQNALHYIFSNNLFNYKKDEEQAKKQKKQGLQKELLLLEGFSKGKPYNKNKTPNEKFLISDPDEYNREQEKQQYVIVDAIMKPFSDSKALDFSNNLRKLLLSKDKNGFAPLHLAFKNMSSDCFKPVLDIVLQSNSDVKKDIVCLHDPQGKNISYWIIVSYPQGNIVEIFNRKFGSDGMRQAIFAQDNNRNTAFHHWRMIEY